MDYRKKSPWALRAEQGMFNDPDGYMLDLGFPADVSALTRSPAALAPVAPVRPGSGLTKKAAEKQQETAQRLSKFATYDDPEQLYAASHAAENLPILARQRDNLDGLQEYMKVAAAPDTKLDLSPLMALADQWTGSKLAQSYKRPESAEEARQKAAVYAMKLQDQKDQLAKNVLDATFKQRSGETMVLDKNVKSEEATETAQDPLLHQRSKTTKEYDPTKDLQKFQKSMEPLAPIKSAFDKMDEAVGGIDKWDGKKDIPGIGGTKLLPMGMLTDAGSKARQAHRNLQNAIQYAISGKQINEQEGKRLSEAIGGGFWSSDRDAVIGMKNFRKELREIMKQREAQIKSVHPEVIDHYRKGGGTTSDDFTIPKEVDATATKTPIKKSKLTPEQEKRRQELLKKAQGG